MSEPNGNPVAPGREAEDATGDLALVVHSHMPYVEGFGTYPFGEEWLFEAFARSHLPVLEAGRDLTVTVSPVLADQLEAPGAAERIRAFVRDHRIERARLDAAAEGLGAAAGAEVERYGRALSWLQRPEADPLDAFRVAAAERGVQLIPATATHAVLPVLATDAGRRLQIDAGLRSHTRRFGRPTAMWLPECAYAPGLEALLGERGLGAFCTDQSPHEPPLDSLVPVRTRSGPVALTIEWETVAAVWGEGGYPSAHPYLDFHRLSHNGIRLWSIGGAPYDPAAAAARARVDAADFVERVGARLDEFAARRGRPGLLTFAVDTELLGHWWTEGPLWLAEVLRLCPERGVRPVTLAQARRRHPAEDRPLRRSSWGEGKDMRTWDSPRVADLAWAARRLELRLLRALADGIPAAAAARAARELLAVQASDWAFLDYRREAGDYPHDRAVAHAEALLEAIDSPGPPDPRMRNLAPDLILAPLLEP